MPRAELDIFAELTCSLSGEPVDIFTQGRKIVVDVRKVSTLVRIARLLSAHKEFRSSARMIKSSLDAAELTVESRIVGEAVARVGYGVKGGFWKMFGLPAMQLKPLVVAKHSLMRY